MRIIAKAKDYYDGVQGIDRDRSVLYVRDRKKVRVPNSKRPCLNFGYFTPPSGMKAYVAVVGFCGKIYPLIDLAFFPRAGGEAVTCYCYSIEDVDAFAKKHLKARAYKAYLGDKARGFWRWSITRRDRIVKFFEDVKAKQDDYAHLFEEHLSPIFIAELHHTDGGVLDFNRLLGPFEFYRVFDAYAAYQELCMFMGNLAMPDKAMPVIDDVAKAQSKGFDRYSFRADPAGGKLRNK